MCSYILAFYAKYLFVGLENPTNKPLKQNNTQNMYMKSGIIPADTFMIDRCLRILIPNFPRNAPSGRLARQKKISRSASSQHEILEISSEPTFRLSSLYLEGSTHILSQIEFTSIYKLKSGGNEYQKLFRYTTG